MTLAGSSGFININNNFYSEQCALPSLNLSPSISSKIFRVKMSLTLLSDGKNGKEG